jgi:hypothetical protein
MRKNRHATTHSDAVHARTNAIIAVHLIMPRAAPSSPAKPYYPYGMEFSEHGYGTQKQKT